MSMTPRTATTAGQKAYSYLRFSTPEQSEGDSFRRQTQLAQQYAERHGLTLDTELTLNDLGISAFRGRNARTGALGAFLKAVDDGTVPEGSLLLVESLDRVSRQDPWDALPLFQQIVNAGVTIVTLQDGKTYSREQMRAEPMRLLESLFVMVRANEESATKSRRLKAAWEGKRIRATSRPLTSLAPAWLRLDKAAGTFSVIEERAAVVRRVFEMTLQGVGQHAIAEILNREGVPVFGDGRHWHRSYVCKLLDSPAVVGTMVPHTVEYVDGKKTRKPGQPVENYYPAIVEQETFASVTAMKLARSPMRGRHTEVSNVLGGLAKCPLCGGTMTRVSKGTGNGNAKLVCAKAKAGAGCRYRAVDYVQVEQALLENASWLVATAPAGSDTLDNEVVKAESGIEATRDEVARLLHEFGRGTSPTAAGLVRELEASIEEQQRHLEALYARQAATTGPFVGRRLAELDAALTSETLDRKAVNTLLRQLLTGATVDYLRGRVVVEWRHGGSSEVVFAWSEA